MKVHAETMLRMNLKKIKHLVELEFLLFHSLLLLLVKRFFFLASPLKFQRLLHLYLSYT